MNRRDFISLLGVCAGSLAGGEFVAFAQPKGASHNIEAPVPSASDGLADDGRTWNFNKWADQEGWTVPLPFTGAVMGGALWLTIRPAISNPNNIEQPRFQIYGDQPFIHTSSVIRSPKGLKLPASEAKKVRMRVLNLSPETDGYIYWRTSENPDKENGPIRFTMDPGLKQWQEVVCHMDDRWVGTIDQIMLAFAVTAVRGDIWIDRIAITEGTPRAQPVRPDVCSDRVVPRITVPGISQDDFHDAFKVLDENIITDVPVFGFKYPVMGPGGHYGENWWQLDSSLAVSGAKWANQRFAENVMRGFNGVQEQNPDGRIDLWGGSAIRGQVGDASSLPRLLEVAYDVARRTDDKLLRQEIYLMTTKYLDWWLSPVKRDPVTKLITAFFEESLSVTFATRQNTDMTPQTLAPMDTNVAVALGCYRASALARGLGKTEEAKQYMDEFHDIKRSINRYLWNETKQAYYNYDVRESKQLPGLICTTFDPLRMRIAPPERVNDLISKLLDPRLFNWGKLPVTTIAMTDKEFIEATGPYDGRQWFGDVWAMRNLPIIAGLEDVGRHELAAELAWATIKAFNGKYTEYLVPSTGEGGGVTRYAWSASLYITAIIEHLFGVDFDRIGGYLRVVPQIPIDLFSKELSLRQLIIPTGGDTRLNLRVKQTAIGKAQVDIGIDGDLPDGNMEILLPSSGNRPVAVTDERGRQLPIVRNPGDLVNVAGIRTPIRSSVRLQFE